MSFLHAVVERIRGRKCEKLVKRTGSEVALSAGVEAGVTTLKDKYLFKMVLSENKRYRRNHQFLIVHDVPWLMQSITNTVQNAAIH